MIKNYLTVALRGFYRQKLYSLINVIGLAAGLACVIFIYLWVNSEISTDRYHSNIDRIYQVFSNIKGNNDIITWESTPGPLVPEIRQTIPGVEYAARLMNNGEQLFQFDEKSFLESGFFGDEDIFRIFSFPILTGNRENPLPDPGSVAISGTLANKLFKEDDPIGKIVSVQYRGEFKVTSVFENIPNSSTIQFDFILPFEVYKKMRGDGFNWGNYDHPTYLLLSQQARPSEVTRKINEQVDNIITAEGEEDYVDFYLQPFSDHYLYSSFRNGVPIGGRIQYVRIFIVVAIFILVIACINYMNMATAKAATRLKEVGIRKVVGAQRKSLIGQFLSESIATSALAMILALLFVYFLLPVFNFTVGKQMALDLSDPKFVLALILIILISGTMAGSYPALYLSSFRPVNVLKGSALTGVGGARLRKILVLFQFALTVILIVSAIIVYQQLDFIRNKNLGYNREYVVTHSARGQIGRSFNAYKNDLLQNPLFKNVARANMNITQVRNQTSSVGWNGKPDGEDVYFRAVVVDHDLLETLEFNLLEGRFLSREFNDTGNFVISKRAVETMGFSDPVGEKISLWGNEGTVVGVIDDFHSRSFKTAIDPIIFYCQPENTGRIYIKIQNEDVDEALTYLGEIYRKYNPEYPFEYSFMSESFDRLYRSEKMIGSLAFGFTIMAIIISGLGLIGLAAYTAERRRKEISIRKTLGATVSELVAMMSREFALLSLIAALLGAPVAYFIMQKFLQGYAYHTNISWEVFAITMVMMVLLALGTVIFQVTKAAMADPASTLRNE